MERRLRRSVKEDYSKAVACSLRSQAGGINAVKTGTPVQDIFVIVACQRDGIGQRHGADDPSTQGRRGHTVQVSSLSLEK